METQSRRLATLSAHIAEADSQQSIELSPCSGLASQPTDKVYSVTLPERLTTDGEWRVHR